MKSRRWGLSLKILLVALGLLVTIFVAISSQTATAAPIDDAAAVICANNTTDGKDKCISNVTANPSKSVICTAVFDYGNFDSSTYGDCGRVYDEGYKADSQTTASQSAEAIGITQVGVNGVPAAIIAEAAYLAAHNTSSNPPVATVSYSQKAQDYCNGKYPNMGNYTTDCMKGYDNPDGNGVCSDSQTAANCIDGQNAAKNSDEYKAAQKSKEAANACAGTYAGSTSYSYSTGQYDSSTHKLIIATTTENGACAFGYANPDTDKICEDTYASSGENGTKDDYKKLVEACNKGKALASNDDSNSGNASCSLGVMGWIICPAVEILGGVTDLMMGLIDGQMQFTAYLSSDTGDAIRSAWSAVLNVANIAFAIAFLIVIYSTATSTGISNYGVKKILPRLLIAAILVNISYYVCAAMIDLSNILGSSIKSFIDVNMTNKVSSGPITDNLSLGSFVGGIMSGAITIVAGVVLLILFWSAALISIITMFVALALRTFGLVAAIVISPLAFVAYLLPNTEKWFKRWLNEFLRLLFVYPMVAAVWGLSQFLVTIIAAGSSGSGGGGGEVLGDVPLLTALGLPLVRMLPALSLIPLFKASGGMMGKLTGLAQQGTNKLGAPLKKINQEQRQFAGQKVQSGLRGIATRGLADKKREMDSAESNLANLERDKAARTFSAGESRRLGELSALGVRNSEQQKEMDALNKKQSDINSGAIPKWDAVDEGNLANARQSASNAANAYRRQTNGVLYRTTFGGAHRRAATANMKHENEVADQQTLGRRLGDDKRFQRSYSGVSPLMDSSTADGRINRALNQAQAIGDKQGAEEREQFKSFLDNVAAVDENGNQMRLTNAMAEKLMSTEDYEVKLANGRTLSWNNMTDNEKLTLFQQASGGSAPEVKRLRDAVERFKDPALRQAAANMIIQSSNKDFLVQGANNAYLGTGQAGSHSEQLLRITQDPLEAGTLDRYAKKGFWDAAIDGLNSRGGVAELAASGDAKAQKSLQNLAGAIQAQLQQPGSAKVVQAVGDEYEQILKAHNAIPGIAPIDIGALFARAKTK